MATLLTACISISVDSNSQASPQANFVTATLIPTRAGFIPATLTPISMETVIPTLAITAPANCINAAVLLRDVTIQDNTQVKAGEQFTKTWEFQNTGTCPWVNYTLKFAAGDQMESPLSSAVDTALPGEKIEISVELTAPSTNGSYTGYFTLNDPSGKDVPIGIEKTFWVKVLVGSDGASPQSVSGGNISTPFIPGGSNSNCAYSQNVGYVAELISLINQARIAAQLPALTVNAQLNAAAQGHSADMACNNFLDHTGSDGSRIGDRIRATGYNTSSYAEIIAIGTPQNAMDQWAADAPHWEIILNPYGGELGVGYAYYANSDFGGYITVDFVNR